MTTMTIPQPDVEQYRVRDQFNTLTCAGQLIGEASTETPESSRWTEIKIYKTVGGSYIVERVGVSLVYHDADAPCASGVSRTVADVLDDDRELEPCERCRPSDIYDTKNKVSLSHRIKVETDRHSASATDVRGVVPALTLRRDNGSEYVSNVAQAALTEAIHNDPELASALAESTVIP